jgi:hypothetical protein
MARTKDEMIPILFRYFMAASLMRQDFYKHLKEEPRIRGKDEAVDAAMFLVSKGGIHMCLWYGMLYVVIEGWLEAKLSDPEIDRLLASPNVEFLKRFRNGMFHFQKDQWLSPKLSDFMDPKLGSVDWVRSLTSEFRRFLMAEMNRISGKPATP